MSDAARKLLRGWLQRQLEAQQSAWLDAQVVALEADPSDETLAIAFGMAPRRLGKADLALSPDDFKLGDEVLPGWQPQGWSLTDAARILFLSGLRQNEKPFAERFRALCRTADVAELIALYRGLPLYPDAAALEPQVGEGLRSNMRAVFEAIAHRNPYPRKYFDQHRWNHMVLKALFIGSPLAPIEGLDERANPELARIMCDFAHERWAGDLALRRPVRGRPGARRPGARAAEQRGARAPRGGARLIRLSGWQGGAAAVHGAGDRQRNNLPPTDLGNAIVKGP
jgi:hypothetical protein